MKQSKHLQNAFSDQSAEIKMRRKTDAALEEICLDFEQLSADLEIARNEPERMSDGLRQDVIDSLHELKQEILRRLKTVSDTSS